MGIVSIGQPVPRHEDPILLRGEGRYTGDVTLPNQAYGYVLRSPHAHAQINSITTSAAIAAPGVLAVLTGQDYRAENLGKLPLVVPPIPNFDVGSVYHPTRLALANEVVNFVGEEVAFVVAETLDQAKDAAEMIEVDYQILPAVVDAEVAMEDGAPQVWPDCPDNLSFKQEMGDREATEAAFTAAKYIVKLRSIVNRSSANTIEARGTNANYDPASGHCTVYVGTQGAFGMRKTLAELIFNDTENNFRVITGNMGGSFGMKGVYAETLLTVWASRKLHRPVKWENERTDSILSDYHGRDKISDAELALDEKGKFLGLRVTTIANLGTYLSPLALMHTILSNGGLVGVYTTPAVHLTIKGVFTHTGSTNPYRGSNRPDVAYVLERLIDVASAETGIDRFELRRQNFISPGDMPYKTPLGPTYDCGDFERNFEDALKLIGHQNFEERRQSAKARGKYRGLGVANNVENAAGAGTEFADILFDANGNVNVYAGTTEHGQGHPTMYRQVVSQLLGIDADKIVIHEGDTDKMEQGNGTGGSRVSSLGTSAARIASEAIIEKGRHIAAHLLEAGSSDIEFSNGSFEVAGTDRSVSWERIVGVVFSGDQLPDGIKPDLSVNAHFEAAAPNFPSGCHACEVEVDVDTGKVEIIRYVGVSDVGNVINPLLLNGQIYGGIGQGAGQVLMEGILYDPETGQMQTGSFLDYAMPRASDFCPFELADNPTVTKVNPMGSKGAGEVGTACAMPAVVNAVVDALSPLGIKHLDMPVTSQKTWAVIKNAITELKG